MVEALIGVTLEMSSAAPPYAPMAGRRELNDEQWAVVEPLLRSWLAAQTIAVVHGTTHERFLVVLGFWE